MENNLKLIDEISGPGSIARVFQWEQLAGSMNSDTAQALYYAEKVGMHLLQVILYVNNAGVTLEPGAIYFMKGNQ